MLSAEMMMCRMGWIEAAGLIVASMSGAIVKSQVTCDLSEIVGVKALSCSDYATVVIEKM